MPCPTVEGASSSPRRRRAVATVVRRTRKDAPVGYEGMWRLEPKECCTLTDQALGTTTMVQVGVVVRDIEATARVWADTFGLPMPEIEITDSLDLAHTEYRGQPSTARAKLAFLSMGQVDVELIEPLGEPSTWKDHLNTQGVGLHHIALRIKGMPERLAYLD